jgi:hypothetical protein
MLFTSNISRTECIRIKPLENKELEDFCSRKNLPPYIFVFVIHGSNCSTGFVNDTGGSLQRCWCIYEIYCWAQYWRNDSELMRTQKERNKWKMIIAFLIWYWSAQLFCKNKMWPLKSRKLLNNKNKLVSNFQYAIIMAMTDFLVCNLFLTN